MSKISCSKCNQSPGSYYMLGSEYFCYNCRDKSKEDNKKCLICSLELKMIDAEYLMGKAFCKTCKSNVKKIRNKLGFRRLTKIAKAPKKVLQEIENRIVKKNPLCDNSSYTPQNEYDDYYYNM